MVSILERIHHSKCHLRMPILNKSLQEVDPNSNGNFDRFKASGEEATEDEPGTARERELDAKSADVTALPPSHEKLQHVWGCSLWVSRESDLRLNPLWQRYSKQCQSGNKGFGRWHACSWRRATGLERIKPHSERNSTEGRMPWQSFACVRKLIFNESKCQSVLQALLLSCF